MSRHILLIDDEDDIREVTSVSLETVAGWRVSSAGSGRAGIELARTARPAAILLDVMMPEQDRPATLRLLRNDKVTAEIPVISPTAKVQSIERARPHALRAARPLASPC